GLALQGTLSNLAAGVMLILFRPFRAGDFVDVAGQSGTVREVSLFFTEFATPDNVQV
ncbi:MAG: mechanosensitive ion channel, partial [Rhodobacteraceae bacterium]|nr:mechanosensitive ion channel [Paracoccaceae bacterium]